MTKTKKRLIACCLFVTGLAGGFVPQPVRAAEAEAALAESEAAGKLQCWHWIWQAQDKCSWCDGSCTTDLCCTTPAGSS